MSCMWDGAGGRGCCRRVQDEPPGLALRRISADATRRRREEADPVSDSRPRCSPPSAGRTSVQHREPCQPPPARAAPQWWSAPAPAPGGSRWSDQARCRVGRTDLGDLGLQALVELLLEENLVGHLFAHLALGPLLLLALTASHGGGHLRVVVSGRGGERRRAAGAGGARAEAEGGGRRGGGSSRRGRASVG